MENGGVSQYYQHPFLCVPLLKNISFLFFLSEPIPTRTTKLEEKNVCKRANTNTERSTGIKTVTIKPVPQRHQSYNVNGCSYKKQNKIQKTQCLDNS